MTLKKLVAKYHGWVENGVALFPSVYLKEQFLKEMSKQNKDLN
jgi:hypothetical protein